MDSIAGMEPKAATRTYINKYIIRSIAAFFIITIGGLLIYSLSQVNWEPHLELPILFLLLHRI